MHLYELLKYKITVKLIIYSRVLFNFITESRRGNSETEDTEGLRRRQGSELPRLIPGQSITDEGNGVREVPGEAEPLQGRVVLGHRPDNSITPDMPLSNRGSLIIIHYQLANSLCIEFLN